MTSSLTVAREFLHQAQSRGETLTPMQLLKLVYIAHGWSLALYNRPLISDEVQAWQYGPVIPRLYAVVRHYKGNQVEEINGSPQEELSSDEKDLVCQVYERYGSLSGPQLSRLTHAQNTPWDQVYYPGSFGTVISQDLIEDHSKSL